MNNLVGCREIELLCTRAIAADRWNDLAHREIAARFQNKPMHAGPMAMRPNTLKATRTDRSMSPCSGCNLLRAVDDKDWDQLHNFETRDIPPISLCRTRCSPRLSHLMVSPDQLVSVIVPRSAWSFCQQTLLPTFSSLDCSPVIVSICGRQTTHREFDLSVR
jgi:hypothetical protein